MRMKQYPFIFIALLALNVTSVPAFAGISFNQNQSEIVIAPTCNHVPINLPYTVEGVSYDESSITVSSDSNWAIPTINSNLDRIDITFASTELIASYTATILVNDGEKVTELFIQASVSPLNVYRLIDDPLRSITYGIQKNGIKKGSIIAFDPVQESFISCVTVGKSPTDFVINDDSTELLVINSVGKSIDVINLDTFTVKETLLLPTYSAWGDADETTANIDLGPEDTIYYTDGAWGPVLHTLKRNTGEVIQSIIFNGATPSNNTGFMDFAVMSDKTKILAMPQYGWSAGGHSSIIGQFSINNNGTVNFVKETSISNFSRDPFEAPVLMSDDNKISVMKTISTDPSNTDKLERVFPSAIWSMNPNGSVVATADKLYDYSTGVELYTIPGGSIYGSGYTYTKAQAFTSDFTRFVYFNESNRSLNVVNLIDEIGLEKLGRSQNPANGSVVNALDVLTWSPLSGVDQYDLYLGTNEDSVTGADQGSAIYYGRITGTSFTLSQSLVNGTDYFWRIDPVTATGPETGNVSKFRVSDIGLDINEIESKTVAGHADYQVDIKLTSEDAGIVWTATAADSWVTFTENNGSTPSTLSVHLDTTTLPAGFHNSSVTLTSVDGELNIPVQLEIDALNITHIRSDRNSAITYAISEDTTSTITQAYLLEIDSAAEKIQRVISVGSSVTDFSIHYPDDLIYITNWKSGNLLVIDKSSFEHLKNHTFQPAGATGYSQGDIYRVAAGGSQRLVFEEEDQWVDIGIYNTNTETTLSSTNVREGGGAFDPTGRYYYHGENNSSGASIIKFDTSGDVFTNITEVRPDEISSYYGSRTVVVSEDGSRIFWAGVVLDKNLETEWGIGEMIHSSSTDGRYAFSDSAIYDVNLKRQILTMPEDTKASGYNSTSEKMITQTGTALGFYSLSNSSSMPTPVISFNNSADESIELSWTDKSLEMEFVVQQRLLGSDTWVDIQSTEANVSSLTAAGLINGSSYEFRVRANSSGYSSPWSNIVIKKENDVIDVLERMLNPTNGGIVNSPDTLTWTAIPWIEQYDLYLGTDEDSVASAKTDSNVYLGRVTGSSFDLAQSLNNGTNYFWRIDPVTDLGPEMGKVYTFKVSDIEVGLNTIEAMTFAGHADYQVEIELSSKEGDVAWTVSASDPWVTFTQRSGSTPTNLSLHLDSTTLSVGSHTSSITLTSESGKVKIPVVFQVDPINITHIRSDRNSSKVYAISEDTSSENSQAYLLEIDSLEEKIERVIAVGSSVTDFSIHHVDDLIYVTNWQSGNLLAINKSTFEQVKNHVFEPAGATGYSQNDVYAIAAGSSNRLIVEEEDQWVDIGIYNTDTDTMLSLTNVREGGGVLDPTGRYYYHGENNSSGASIIKFDTSGDTFTSLVEVRPDEISSYYGSRTVNISEDGSRIFWAGVAFDKNLVTEWGIGDTIYSTSTDGRYVFGENAIYDIDLKRQVLAMPESTRVSGYNSTTDKLIAPVNGLLKFYSLSTPIALKAPVLNLSVPSVDTIQLNWSDESLEMAFEIQQKELRSDTWINVHTTEANVISWFTSGLKEDTAYEFRVRAYSPFFSSPWSNIKRVLQGNEVPEANDDVIILSSISEQRFTVIQNDKDFDGKINPASIVIYTQPKFGQINIHENGDVTYTPDDYFVQTDSFSYTVNDNDEMSSSPAMVTIIYIPTPTIEVGNSTFNSIELSWTEESVDLDFVVQQREFGSSTWIDLENTSDNLFGWTAGDLNKGTVYEYRVRATHLDASSPWSNIITSTTPKNVVPVAGNDIISFETIAEQRFSLTMNDLDADGEVNLGSITIVTQPQFGQVNIHENGEVTYIPGNNFIQTDSFSYTVNDNNDESSSPATVTLIYIPIPSMSISNLTYDSIELSWIVDESLELSFEIQQRVSGSDAWTDISSAEGDMSKWTVDNLLEKTTYEFRIRASSANNFSPWSNVAVGTVPEKPISEVKTESKSGGGSVDLFSMMFLLVSLVMFRRREGLLGKR